MWLLSPLERMCPRMLASDVDCIACTYRRTRPHGPGGRQRVGLHSFLDRIPTSRDHAEHREAIRHLLAGTLPEQVRDRPTHFQENDHPLDQVGHMQLVGGPERCCGADASIGMLTAVNPAPEHIGSSVSVSLRVRDLSARDLSACTWSGSATHLRHVEEELVRAAAGEVDYLAVCTAADLPVAIGGVDYRVADGAGTLWQLAVLPALQGHGLGTLLIRAAEQRIRDRGLHRAELSVEEDNPRARSLYERLGYVVHGRAPDAWDAEGPDGVVRRYEAMCVLMRRDV